MKKLILLGSCLVASGIANAEIVTNSKGESINLKSDGTWVKINEKNYTKLNNDNYVKNNDVLTLDVKDGNNNSVPVKVFIRVLGDPQKQISEKSLVSNLELTAFKIKLYLKNKYSFQPKSATITVGESSMDITMEYLAKNSYGADVVGNERVEFEQQSDGRYSPKR